MDSEPGMIAVMSWKLFKLRLLTSVSQTTWMAIEQAIARVWLKQQEEFTRAQLLEQMNQDAELVALGNGGTILGRIKADG